jgi:WD40 repeat protein
VILRDPLTYEYLEQVEDGGNGTLAWSPDGQWLAASDWVGGIRMWNVSAGTFQQERIIQPAIYEIPDQPAIPIVVLQFNQTGTELLSVSSNGIFTGFDANTGNILQTRQLSEAPIYAASFSPDGALLAYGSEQGTLEILSIAALSH